MTHTLCFFCPVGLGVLPKLPVGCPVAKLPGCMGVEWREKKRSAGIKMKIRKEKKRKIKQ